MKLQFSGHESFVCRHFWLKKGYDFVISGGNFTDEQAVVKLGVGKNMVSAISFWLKAFGITDNQGNITPLGDYIFNDETGFDPFVENYGTVLLLHYFLIKTGKASVYSIFFNEFRKGRADFTKEQFANFIMRKLANEEHAAVNGNTVMADVSVFIKSYLKPDFRSARTDVEDDYTGLLLDLELIKSRQQEDSDGKMVERFFMDIEDRSQVPAEIILFMILDNEDFGKSVPFKHLLSAPFSPGAVLLINDSGMHEKINDICSRYPQVIFTETAGIGDFQIRQPLDKWTILNDYYR